MNVHFYKVPVRNMTQATLQINPWTVAGILSPDETDLAEGLSDGVFRRNVDGSLDFYEWTRPASVHPGTACFFNLCTDRNIFLALRDAGDGSPDDRILIADFKSHHPRPVQAQSSGVDLSIIDLEYDREDFGASYDALSFRFLGNSAITKTQIVSLGGEGVVYGMHVVESEKTLAKEISFSVSASANILGAEVSGAASMLSRVDMKATSVSLVSKQVVSLGYKQLDKEGLKLREDLDHLMATDPVAFYKQYGTHFISGAAGGGSLTIVLTREYQSLGEKLEAASSAKLKYGSVSASSEFKASIASFSSNNDASVNIDQSGWLGKIPSMNAAEIVGYVEVFPLMVKQSTSRGVFKVELTPLNSIASAEASKVFQALVDPVFKTTSRFIDIINEYVDVLAEIAYVDSIGLGDQVILRQWEAEIQDDINVLKVVWNEHRGGLTLPPVESVLEQKHLKPPSDYQAMIRPVLNGSPLVAGVGTYVRYMSAGRVVSKYQESYLGRVATWEYCPNMGDKGVQWRFSIVGGKNGDAIKSGDTLTIETLEALPKGQETCQMLSAFSDHYLYYYYPGHGANQQWRIEKVGGSGPIKYGDKVRLINLAYNQQLKVETGMDSGTGLTTGSVTEDLHWVIEKS